MAIDADTGRVARLQRPAGAAVMRAAAQSELPRAATLPSLVVAQTGPTTAPLRGRVVARDDALGMALLRIARPASVRWISGPSTDGSVAVGEPHTIRVFPPVAAGSCLRLELLGDGIHPVHFSTGRSEADVPPNGSAQLWVPVHARAPDDGEGRGHQQRAPARRRRTVPGGSCWPAASPNARPRPVVVARTPSLLSLAGALSPASRATFRSCARRRATRARDRAWLLGVFAVAVLLSVIATRWTFDMWTWQNDEFIFRQTARWIGDNLPSSLWATAEYMRGVQRLNAWLFAFCLDAFGSPTGFKVARWVIVLAYASTVVPVWLLARAAGAERAWAALAALGAVLVPWAGLTGTFLTEGLAYPLVGWACLAIFATVANPSPRADVVALAAIGASMLARTGLVLLLFALAVAVLGQELRLAASERELLRAPLRLVRRHAVLVAVGLVGLLLLALGRADRLTGSWYENAGPRWEDTWHGVTYVISSVAAGVGFVPVLAALGFGLTQIVRPRSPRDLALAWLVVRRARDFHGDADLGPGRGALCLLLGAAVRGRARRRGQPARQPRSRDRRRDGPRAGRDGRPRLAHGDRELLGLPAVPGRVVPGTRRAARGQRPAAGIAVRRRQGRQRRRRPAGRDRHGADRVAGAARRDGARRNEGTHRRSRPVAAPHGARARLRRRVRGHAAGSLGHAQIRQGGGGGRSLQARTTIERLSDGRQVGLWLPPAPEFSASPIWQELRYYNPHARGLYRLGAAQDAPLLIGEVAAPVVADPASGRISPANPGDRVPALLVAIPGQKTAPLRGRVVGRDRGLGVDLVRPSTPTSVRWVSGPSLDGTLDARSPQTIRVFPPYPRRACLEVDATLLSPRRGDFVVSSRPGSASVWHARKGEKRILRAALGGGAATDVRIALQPARGFSGKALKGSVAATASCDAIGRRNVARTRSS